MDIGLKDTCDLKVEKFISEGGFGNVYKVSSTKTNDKLALKMYKNKEITVYDIEEIAIGRYLLNQNILRISRIVHQDECLPADRVGILLPLAKDILKLPFKFKPEKFLHQMVDALDYIHNACIIHADLKPENILVMPNGQYLLSDFGLSVIVPFGGFVERPFRGTKEYMYPSNYDNDTKKYIYNSQIDIYALGLSFNNLYQRYIGKQTTEYWYNLVMGMINLDYNKIFTIEDIRKYMKYPSTINYEVNNPTTITNKHPISKKIFKWYKKFITTEECTLSTLLHYWDFYFLFLQQITNELENDDTVVLSDGSVRTGEEIFHSLLLTAIKFTEEPNNRWISRYCKYANTSLILQWMKTMDDSLYRNTLAEYSLNRKDFIYLLNGIIEKHNNEDPETIIWYEIHRLDMLLPTPNVPEPLEFAYSINLSDVKKQLIAIS